MLVRVRKGLKRESPRVSVNLVPPFRVKRSASADNTRLRHGKTNRSSLVRPVSTGNGLIGAFPEDAWRQLRRFSPRDSQKRSSPLHSVFSGRYEVPRLSTSEPPGALAQRSDLGAQDYAHLSNRIPAAANDEFGRDCEAESRVGGVGGFANGRYCVDAVPMYRRVLSLGAPHTAASNKGYAAKLPCTSPRSAADLRVTTASRHVTAASELLFVAKNTTYTQSLKPIPSPPTIERVNGACQFATAAAPAASTWRGELFWPAEELLE
ncbi:hypothetical protein B0H17DRAFT_1144408 [Mycena rosella]|uniref:Uncharacterized protein n=1 Tax=Mycena rosella TaxID=1033263 RepID=A0AAD7G2Y2_MYCRO|nr:hypothetical protein B0H17DRAFT_1144408 [Mycena rosella]